MENKILRVAATLGVPGLALAVMYLLLKSFGFNFSTIDPTMSAAIAIIFLILVGGITAYALHLWRPHRPIPATEVKVMPSENRDKFLDSYRAFEIALVSINDKNPQDGTKAVQYAINFFGDVAREFYIRNQKVLRTSELERLLSVISDAVSSGKLNEPGNHAGKREFGMNIIAFCTALHKRVLEVT